MRLATVALGLSAMLVACHASSPPPGDLPDAPPPPDAAGDAPCEHRLLTGGAAPDAQGWTVIQEAPATLTVQPDELALRTATPTGAQRGGQLLLARANTFVPGTPLKLEVVIQVDQVSAHNALDAAVAILGSLNGTVGNQTDREQMIYLDAGALGWADDTQRFATAIAGAPFRTIVLAIDAGGDARVTIDGAPALTRTGFVSNGTIAVGDQSNEPNLDSVIHIRSITQLCP